MAGSSKAPFLLPANFVDNPTEAPFPRRLIVYDGASDAWDATDDKDIIVKTKYLFVSYRNSDFAADADRLKLELNVQTVCHALQLPAYWLDYACTGSTQEEKNMDLYRIADVVRNAAKTLIVIKGGDESRHSPGWLSWGDRLWTLPEALLSGYGGDRLLYKAGTKPHKSVTLRDVANHAYKDGDKEMSLMNNYRGEPVIQSDIFFELLIKAIWKRTSGPEEEKEKAGALTAYEAERVYALMGFMPERIIPDPNESEEEAFKRLMKENRFDKDLHTILNSSEKDIPLNVSMMPSMDSEQIWRVLDKIPYTGEMRYDTGKRCLDGTRVGILEEIINCIDNKDGKYSGKRIFLLTGVAGSGKSTIANSIAFHYDKIKQLGSSFFFSAADKKSSSQPHNLFRNIARDLADNNLQFRAKLFNIVSNNIALSTTSSIQEQFQKFIDEIVPDIALEHPIVIVIDALDECAEGGDNRAKLLDILAKKLSGGPQKFRVFVTSRPISDVTVVFSSSQYVEHFHMDTIDSTWDDIQAFFRSELSKVAEELSTVDLKWLVKLTNMAGNLFIYAEIACRYILEPEVRRPKEKLRNILSLQKEADLNSPIPYLYELYAKVLNNIVDKKMARHNLQSVRERVTRVLGMVLMAYRPLSSDDIDEMLGPNDNATGIVGQMGTLLNGVSNPEEPVRLLHASFGDFLRDENLNEAFYVNPQRQHAEMAKKCLEVMNRPGRLKFNIFDLKDVSVPASEDYSKREETRTQLEISIFLQYCCQYWPTHITQMSKDDFGLIEEPLRQFLFEDKHLMHWIEVISAKKEVDAAREALLSLYQWLKEINCVHERISQLIAECYHLLCGFNEAIALGPLQVYESALPYLPPESPLYALYKEQAMLSPKILFGHIKDIRLFSLTLLYGPLDVFFRHIKAIAFSNNGSQIAFLSNTSLEIVDFTTWSRLIDVIALKPRYGDSRSSVVFSPDGCKIAILRSGSIETWDLVERRLHVSLRNNHRKADIVAISFFDNAHVFYCRKQSSIIEISEWTISEDRIVTYPLQRDSAVTCVGLSSNAKYLGSISEANEVTVWELRTREAISTINLGGREDIYSVLAISDDEEHVACGSNKGTVKLWNFQTGSLVWTGEIDGAIKQILMPLSLDSKQLVTVSEYGYVYVWDMTSGSRYMHESSVLSMVAALSPDGRHLVTSLERRPRVWAIEASKDEAILLPREELEEVFFLNDGSLIAGGTGVKEGDIVVCDKFGSANVSRQTLEGHEQWIKELRFSPDGNRLLSRDSDYNLILWSRDNNDVRFSLREKLKFDRREALMDAVSLTSGSILVAGSRGNNIVVWNNYEPQLQNVQKQVFRCEGNVRDVRLTSDGRGLVGWDGKYYVFLWCRGNDDAQFELREKRACNSYSECQEYFNQLVYRQSEDTPEDLQSPAPQTQADGSKDNTGEEIKKGPSFTFDAKMRWVHLVGGRKLWYIPECFLGYNDNDSNDILVYLDRFRLGGCKSTQKGRKIVVYGPRLAILFEYKDDFVHTLLK